MTYREFSLAQVQEQFALSTQMTSLFPDVAAIAPSEWLSETLEASVKLALLSANEKARSEFIVAPILLEIEKRNPNHVSIFSGMRLDIDEAAGLKGECDFLLSKQTSGFTIEAPIFCLVEAKKNDVSEGLGQGVAQMLGAQKFNEISQKPINVIHGCVTTGETWQFLRLIDKKLFFDKKRYYLNELNTILGILQSFINL